MYWLYLVVLALFVTIQALFRPYSLGVNLGVLTVLAVLTAAALIVIGVINLPVRPRPSE